jgi:hypothetical protein
MVTDANRKLHTKKAKKKRHGNTVSKLTNSSLGGSYGCTSWSSFSAATRASLAVEILCCDDLSWFFTSSMLSNVVFNRALWNHNRCQRWTRGRSWTQELIWATNKKSSYQLRFLAYNFPTLARVLIYLVGYLFGTWNISHLLFLELST